MLLRGNSWNPIVQAVLRLGRIVHLSPKMEGGHSVQWRQEPPDSELLTVTIVADERFFCNIREAAGSVPVHEYEMPADRREFSTCTTYSKPGSSSIYQ